MTGKRVDETNLGDSQETLDAVLIKRSAIEEARNPDIRMSDYVVLKSGPRAHKVATHWTIVDRNTGELHHHAIKIETYRKTRDGWFWDEEHSITLGDSEEDELTPLATFLAAILNAELPSDAGRYLVVPLSDESVSNESIRRLLDAVSSGGKAAVIAESLAIARGNPDVLCELAKSTVDDPQASKVAVATINMARFTSDLQELERLVAINASEAAFQGHLTERHWIFGSEYSELLDRRRWTRDEQQDFVVRRTADNFLEIIEIKTPLDGKDLFLEDPSHHTFYPRSELSAVVGQVTHYLEKLDTNRQAIRFEDGEDVNKIRAKVIIGRDGDANQVAALRRLNGHLHRIEILTFDQLIRIGRHVLASLEAVLLPDD